MIRSIIQSLVGACLLCPLLVLAFEATVSGYGTIGYAKSDQPFAYQRFVSDRGSFKRDSVVGLQFDAKLGDRFSLTVQGKAAASANSDAGVRADIAWAFLSYRPSNDWLIRVGRFRAPMYLHSETLDVGATFDQVSLPVEVYSQSPTTDFNGISASKTWNLSSGELVLDGYWGSARTALRAWFREGFGADDPPGVVFLPIAVNVRGLALALRGIEHTLRLGFADAVVDRRTTKVFITDFPFIDIPGLPGVGYYGVGDGIAPVRSQVRVRVLTMGVDIQAPNGWRMVGEYGRRSNKQSIGYDSQGAYAALLRRSGSWTPYVSYAFLRSSESNRRLYAAVNENRVPDFIPGAALINLYSALAPMPSPPMTKARWLSVSRMRLHLQASSKPRCSASALVKSLPWSMP